MRGVAYVAIGAKAKREAAASMETLDLPIAVIEVAEYSDPMQASAVSPPHVPEDINHGIKRCTWTQTLGHAATYQLASTYWTTVGTG